MPKRLLEAESVRDVIDREYFDKGGYPTMRNLKVRIQRSPDGFSISETALRKYLRESSDRKEVRYGIKAYARHAEARLGFAQFMLENRAIWPTIAFSDEKMFEAQGFVKGRVIQRERDPNCQLSRTTS